MVFLATSRAPLHGSRSTPLLGRGAPFEKNLPVLMGLLAVWYRDFFGAETVGVMPYDQYLKRFPAYLQQLTMESNGKHVTLDGKPVAHDTGAIYWGEPGTNGQHSFYQLIHQGTSLVPVDLIVSPGRSTRSVTIMTYCLPVFQHIRTGQGTGLRTHGGGDPRRWSPRTRRRPQGDGRQPADQRDSRRDPHALSARDTHRSVRAQRDHQGSIWGIDSFDQWGVELEKVMAGEIAPQLTSADEPALNHDSSTNALIRRYRRLKNT